ncbi:FAD-dependent oxidoreductase [Clostridium sp. Marseille-Q2269]|uniref:NAD(P)/FAD-dependent oxidoreductase n=1 Tax=Clostridium sp. Marseille-Q2269 TaxID=2942205 RepID=UPI0020744A27|nr:FAD-dependent oxidoreductase [Clostridium sp. Marseille-Q2269]
MKYVIIGSSAGGISAVKTLRTLDKDAEIVIISKDDKVYSRCLLHHFIGGSRDVERLSFVEKDFFEKYNVKWIKGNKVQNIDIDKKVVKVESGIEEKYDKLLIASGSYASIPPIKNLREAKRVYTLRNLDDAIVIKEEAKKIKKAAVIGAGLVGIDATMGLVENNVEVTVIEMGNRMLPLQLDERASKSYEDLFKQHNVNIKTSVGAEEALLDNKGNVCGIKLNNGKVVECDIVVVAAGVRPNVDFIKDDRIKIERGIVINDNCETTGKDIYAAGDVTFRAPIWPIAMKQGRTAASNMAGQKMALEDNFGARNSMNFLGVYTISLGIVEPKDESYKVDIIDKNGVYKKIIHKDGIIYGAILQGDIAYAGVLTELIKNKIDISKINKDIFDISFADFYHIKENGEFSYK